MKKQMHETRIGMYPEMISRQDLLAHVGKMDQMASIKRYAIDDGKGRGMRALEVSNGSGFDFTVYPDRGLDIGPARWNGRSLTWMSRNGAVHPAFYDASGAEWLRTWQGGLLTTCGWLNAGNPCETESGAQGLHGRMDHTPAEEVNTRCFWKGDDYCMEITGRIVLARVFGENLVTTRTLTTQYGYAGVEINDHTENIGATTQPFMQLYHMNFGYPLISESTRLVASEHAIEARDAAGESGLAAWNTMPSPTADFNEQVLYHDLPENEYGECAIKIDNPRFFEHDKMLILSFRKAELPFLVQWRQAGIGDYVMGLEPANCYPIGQANFRNSSLLRHIEPGQSIDTKIKLEIR